MPTPYPHQREGATFLAAHSFALLADEPGVGKTAQAILACDLVRANYILVICPAVAKENWRREFKTWQTARRSLYVHQGTGRIALNSFELQQVVIVNYDPLSQPDSEIAAQLRVCRWDVIILDEAHYLKSSASNRTKVVYQQLVSTGKYVWLLTGTPAPNHAGEVWTHLRYASMSLFGTPHEDELAFQDRFCLVRDTIYGRQITGSKNLQELRSRYLDGWMLRRKKEILNLPPLRFVAEPLTGVKLDAHTPELQKIVVDNASDDDNVLSALRGADIHLASERRLTGELKIKPALELIKSELTGNKRKLVIFAIHQTVIDGLLAGTVEFGSVGIDGRTANNDRQRAIDAFQNQEDCRVFVGNIKAAGTAITLTAASMTLFVETSFTPADNFQAASRCHRIGQNDAVLARFLHLPGSIDETVQKILARKATDLAELFG